MILPEVFAVRFNLPTTFSLDKNEKPSGSLIEFIAATLKEIGIDYRPRSIARAITRLRK